ncbi:hypothetical protein SADUNF_Sadunf01G0081200 [Salix dunnii]|uniref:Uncharacterized protein n=1 Tax=Salix dunnii TaxID=1413687 RepID=A0A835NA39_9ROSI|nr:hypothetical protein SADUNF_Sadunf01G0081200 [Salix dunnii]
MKGSFNASSTLTRKENGMFEIDFFFNFILSKTGCMDAATIYGHLLKVKGIKSREEFCAFRSLKNLQILYSHPLSRILSYETRFDNSDFIHLVS